MSNNNEHHDLLRLRESTIGLEALHALAPDEEMMRREEEEMDYEAAEVAAGRDEVFMTVTTNAFAGRPSLREAGYRVWIMGLRMHARMPVAKARDVREMRAVAVRCNGGLRVRGCARAAVVVEWICGKEWCAERIGRRASLLAYAFNRGPVVRDALPNFATIGGLWELTAANKRSAVSAAMNKLREEMVRTAQVPAGFRFWFEKSPEARVVYAAAQMGNANRSGGGGAEGEEMGSQARTPEMRRRFEVMERRAEERRLERVVIARGDEVLSAECSVLRDESLSEGREG